MNERDECNDPDAWPLVDDDLLPGRAITATVSALPSHLLLMPAAKDEEPPPERDFWSHRLAPLRGFDDLDRGNDRDRDRFDDLQFD